MSALSSGWEEFIYWAKRFEDWSGFDRAERDYKLRLAEKVTDVRRLLLDGSDEWVEELRETITSKENNSPASISTCRSSSG